MTLLIHPGFHKTATTWLQNAVFADRRFFDPVLTHDEADRLFVRPHDFALDLAAAKDLLNKRLATRGGSVQVISSEILSGNILLGSRDCVAIAARLAAVVSNAKVLLTVRAQQPIMRSIYVQYLKRGGRLPLEQYLAFRPDWGYMWFDPVTLEFDRLADVYAGHFGRQNVIVLPQELLKRDRARYLRLLMDFVAIDPTTDPAEFDGRPEVGISPPVASIPVLRFANALRNTTFNPAPEGSLSKLGNLIWSAAHRWSYGEQRAVERSQATIAAAMGHSRYAASNARLQAYCPVDLAELGYDVLAAEEAKSGGEAKRLNCAAHVDGAIALNEL